MSFQVLRLGDRVLRSWLKGTWACKGHTQYTFFGGDVNVGVAEVYKSAMADQVMRSPN